ncbi:MAG: NAD-dependent deacylase [Planctomycetota bacterium]
MSDADASLLDACRRARRVLCVTGAGVSRGSGVPTYRDAMTGLWANYRPEELATPEAFAADPALVTRWYDERRLACLKCYPNDGHRAVARWQHRLDDRPDASFTLVTQNVDDLHERAGSPADRVHHIHGTMFRWLDPRTGQRYDASDNRPLVDDDRYPPRSSAGHALRPDIVWFGETLPTDVLAVVQAALEDCDLFISAGTSGVVHPVAGFVHAVRPSAVTVEVNPEPTPISPAFDHTLREPAEVGLPRLVGDAQGED